MDPASVRSPWAWSVPLLAAPLASITTQAGAGVMKSFSSVSRTAPLKPAIVLREYAILSGMRYLLSHTPDFAAAQLRRRHAGPSIVREGTLTPRRQRSGQREHGPCRLVPRQPAPVRPQLAPARPGGNASRCRRVAVPSE
eukprot:scaffold673_cov410-Prasinococcus_capsulatus_cf.AAC.10